MLSFDWIADPAIWASLVTLTVMEIVLGIDNIVFISVIVGKLPPEHRRSGPARSAWRWRSSSASSSCSRCSG